MTAVGTVAGVVPGGEGGLLGLAVSPSFATDRLVFVYYTASDSRIVRFRFENGQMGAQQVVLSGIPKGTIHNGGRIAFGPDGMLYAGVGETGNTALAQNLSSLGGKILRMSAHERAGPGNRSARWCGPTGTATSRAWPGTRRRMYATEFGQNTFDEVNRIQGREQLRVAHGRGHGHQPGLHQPAAHLDHGRGVAQRAGLRRRLAVGGRAAGRRLWQVPLTATGGVGAVAHLTNQFGRLRTLITAPDGTLWVTTSNRDGRGTPTADDDRILALTLGGTDPEPGSVLHRHELRPHHAGRARAVFFFWASAVGSGDFLGARSATTSLRETSPGFWDRVTSC